MLHYVNYNICNLLSLAQKFCLVQSTERWRIFQIPLQGWPVACPRNATLFSSDISVWPDWPTMCLVKHGRNSRMGALAFWPTGTGGREGARWRIPLLLLPGLTLNYYSFFANLQKNSVCWVLSSWLFEKSGQAGRMHHKVVHIVPWPTSLSPHPPFPELAK